MGLSVVVLSIPIFFILMGIELVLDRIEHRKLYRLNDSVTNISCGIGDQITGVFASVVTVFVYTLAYKFRFWEVPNHWVWWIVGFFLVDLAYYWAHRMSHQINLFWAGHVVHHQSEEYNLSVALRQSAFQKFFSMFFYIPVALLGFPPEWYLVIIGLNLLYQFWIHTELVGKLWEPIEWFFNTPSHHRVHHGRDPKYIDKNHAGVFIIWDRMFGTFQEEEERPTYGITTPLNSWNPIYAQVQHFEVIYKDITKVEGLKNKLSVLFNKPGWLPKELGGYRAPQLVDKKTYQKFDVQISQQMNHYLLVQYILLLGLTAFFLFEVSNFEVLSQIVIAAWILVSTTTLGLLFEAKKWALWVETGRLLVVIPGVTSIFWDSLSFWTTGLTTIGMILVAVFWLWRVAPGLDQSVNILPE